MYRGPRSNANVGVQLPSSDDESPGDRVEEVLVDIFDEPAPLSDIEKDTISESDISDGSVLDSEVDEGDDEEVDHLWNACPCEPCAEQRRQEDADLKEGDADFEEPFPPSQFKVHHGGAPKRFAGAFAPFKHGVNFVLLCVVLGLPPLPLGS
jgi:hypothetical protein